MTLIVNEGGIVYKKDLSVQMVLLARAISGYGLGQTWKEGNIGERPSNRCSGHLRCKHR